MINWKSLWAAVSFCTLGAIAFAQKTATTLPYRFATQAEAQMLVTDIDSYTQNLNQKDIAVRMQRADARKSALLTLAMKEMKSWNDAEKTKIQKAMSAISAEIKKQKYLINLPSEIILVKSGMQEEGGANGYTRKNWIAINEKMMEASDDDLKLLLAHELFHLITRTDLFFKRAAYLTIGFHVLDEEINFPSDILEKRISNPDISRNDSYANLTVEGKAQNCALILYSDKAYEGGSLRDYVTPVLVPLNEELIPEQIDGRTVTYDLDQATDLYEKIGRNSSYIAHPEEILADHFAYIIIGKKDVPNPELLDQLKNILKAK